VFASSGSLFTMESGSVSGNTVANSDGGGGVLVSFQGAFDFEGGSVFGNVAYGDASGGGGVRVDFGGEFAMGEGATIFANTAAFGGGVFVGPETYLMPAGIFSMRGGVIYGADAIVQGRANEAPQGAAMLSQGIARWWCGAKADWQDFPESAIDATIEVTDGALVRVGD